MKSMSREDFYAHWSALHGNAEIRGIVRWWLTISYAIARALLRVKFTANGLTALGVLLSIGLAFSLYESATDASSLVFAILLLVLALASDGLDGTVAILTGSASRRGAALDAISDRIAESLWAYAFILLGAEPIIVMVAWLAAQIQEYLRARLGGLGISEIGVVTVSERPVRASFLAVALVMASIYSFFESGEILSLDASLAISMIAAIWLILQSFALIQLTRFAIRSTIGMR
jgi:CDP-diacylglycerol--glycerol-3-phosphate 3-phosphatidyltransferase